VPLLFERIPQLFENLTQAYQINMDCHAFFFNHKLKFFVVELAVDIGQGVEDDIIAASLAR
jgi:hypothetical protein